MGNCSQKPKANDCKNNLSQSWKFPIKTKFQKSKSQKELDELNKFKQALIKELMQKRIIDEENDLFKFKYVTDSVSSLQ